MQAPKAALGECHSLIAIFSRERIVCELTVPKATKHQQRLGHARSEGELHHAGVALPRFATHVVKAGTRLSPLPPAVWMVFDRFRRGMSGAPPCPLPQLESKEALS
jgi:hypothetical protein